MGSGCVNPAIIVCSIRLPKQSITSRFELSTLDTGSGIYEWLIHLLCLVVERLRCILGVRARKKIDDLTPYKGGEKRIL